MRSEQESGDVPSDLLLKTSQGLMRTVCLCPLGPRSFFLTESWLLIITCNPISYCNVRSMPHLSKDCWKWASSCKARNSSCRGGRWSIDKSLYYVMASLLNLLVKDIRIQKYKQWAFLCNLFGIFLAFPHLLFGTLGLESGIIALFSVAGFMIELGWWRCSVNTTGSAHACK